MRNKMWLDANTQSGGAWCSILAAAWNQDPLGSLGFAIDFPIFGTHLSGHKLVTRGFRACKTCWRKKKSGYRYITSFQSIFRRHACWFASIPFFGPNSCHISESQVEVRMSDPGTDFGHVSYIIYPYISPLWTSWYSNFHRFLTSSKSFVARVEACVLTETSSGCESIVYLPDRAGPDVADYNSLTHKNLWKCCVLL